MKILFVEDEIRMAQALCEILRLEKYEVDYYSSGTEGMAAIENDIYDIIILDVMLPGMNGMEIVRNARKKGITTPVLMLTAKSELEDKVRGLDSGADDYLTKPFMTRELLARLRALGRRKTGEAAGFLTFGDIKIDTNLLTLTCTSNNQSVELSEKEYRILECLISSKGQTISRSQLSAKVWKCENNQEYGNIEIYMCFTRKKLKFVNSQTQIKSIRGIGYILRECDV